MFFFSPFSLSLSLFLPLCRQINVLIKRADSENKRMAKDYVNFKAQVAKAHQVFVVREEAERMMGEVQSQVLQVRSMFLDLTQEEEVKEGQEMEIEEVEEEEGQQ